MPSTSIPQGVQGTAPRGRNFLALSWRKCALCSAVLISASFFAPQPSRAQDPQQEASEEILANLCAGRVAIGIAKDGIVVATLENPIEAETRPPMIVPISDERVAVLLGACDWWLPAEHRELARIDKELPDLPPSQGLHSAPSLGGTGPGDGTGGEANDIEQLAERLHNRLNAIAAHIHANLNFTPEEPILEVVLADYAPNYGPEIWLIQYPIEQEPDQGDFWETTVLQPQYTQLWPPEKGAPRGIVEISFPPEPANQTVSALVRAGDPRISAALSSSGGLRDTAASILDGRADKIAAVDVAAFLRESLHAIALPAARMIEAEINKERGIGWFIAPPVETPVAGTEQVRPPGAPSLRRPTSKPPGPGSF